MNKAPIAKRLFAESGLELGDDMNEFFDTAFEAGMTATKAAWVNAISMAFSAKLSEAALAKHAVALKESALAAEKHAASLVWATRILAAATIVLVIATFVLAFRSAG